VEGRRIGLIDNVLEGCSWVTVALLQQSTGTGRTILREFGKKNLREYYPETFFAVNGINIEISADVTGRIILTSIVPLKSWQQLHYERTEQQLRDLAKEKHPEVVRAFAVFHRYWEQQGKPPARILEGNFDAYKRWCNEVMSILNCVGYTRILENLPDIQTEENSAEELHLNMINSLYDHWGLDVQWTADDLTIELLAEGKLRKQGNNVYTGPAVNDKILSTMPEEIIKKAIDGSLSPDSVGRVALSKIVRRKVANSTVFLDHKRRKYFFRKIEIQTTLK